MTISSASKMFRKILFPGIVVLAVVPLLWFKVFGHNNSPAASADSLRPAATSKTSSETTEYRNNKFQLAFQYPADWQIEEWNAAEEIPYLDRVRYQIRLKAKSGEFIAVVSVFQKPKDFENFQDWLRETQVGIASDGWLNFDQAKGMVSGKEAYLWQTSSGQDFPGGSLAIQGDDYLYEIGFPATESRLEEIQALINSLSTGLSQGPTQLPFNIQSLAEKIPLERIQTPLVQGCCGETDSSTNTYPCCAPKGNCTWKSEERRPGSNNFIFGGSGRDAYTWMSHTKQYTSYAQGGTIPVVGAVLVAIKSYGGVNGVGHVGTVSSVNSDGSVVLVEQNCGSTCTRSQSYTTTWLRTYLAGYIYNATSPPNPTPKNVGAGETIIDDFNFSNTYNFSAKGPGATVSWNGNYRAWGTSDTGAYNNWMHYTTTRTGASENAGQWSVNILNAGFYEIRAYIPNNSNATANSARYKVNGVYCTAVNQAVNHGAWVKLLNPSRADGNWSLGTGVQSVELADTDGGSSGLSLAFDAIKFNSVAGGAAPSVTTGSATSVTSNSATLNGTVNPNGQATTVYFQWGTTTGYGNQTSSQSAGGGTNPIGVSAPIGGLVPNTTYHYRLVGSNGFGTNFGSDVAFTTSSSGTAIISVTPASQNFGAVPVGSFTDRTFAVQNVGTGTLSGGASVSAPFSIVSGGSYNLAAGQTQTVTVRFIPTAVTSYSQNVIFTGGGGASRQVTGTGTSSGAAPSVTTGSATSVTSNSATLNGTVNPNGQATTVYFQWGTTTGYGNQTSSQSAGGGTNPIGVSAPIGGLVPNTTYHYRLVGSNGFGTNFGSDVAFTTSPSGGGIAQMTSPPPGSTLNGSTVTFTWTSAPGATDYWLWVGNSAGGSDLYNQEQFQNLSTTVGNLPTDGRTIHVTLWTFIGGWQYNSYFYTTGGGGVRNRLQNPGFENGHVNWAEFSSGGFSIITNQAGNPTHTGSWYAWLGGVDNLTEYVYQDVTVPANATQANVEFWYRITTQEGATSTCFDRLVVEVRRPSDNALLATLATLCNYNQTSAWVRMSSLNVWGFRGQTIRLQFYATQDSSLPTNFFLDDVALMADGN